MTNINHQAGNFLYEIAAWSDDVLDGKRDFAEMYDAIGSRLVPIADELIRQAPRPSSALPDVTDDEQCVVPFNDGEWSHDGPCHSVIDELRALWQAALEREGNLAAAVADVIWKATPFGEREDESIASYLIPSGTVHRLVGVAQSNGAHVPVAFRNLPAPALPDVQPQPDTCGPKWHERNENCPNNVPPDYCGCECHA